MTISDISKIFISIFNENQNIETKTWLQSKLQKLDSNYSDSVLFTSFSSAFRFVENKNVLVSQIQINQLKELNPNFYISHWDCLTLARVILLQNLPKNDFDNFKKPFFLLFDNADIREQEALYHSFAYLPFAEKLVHKFSLGISSNIGSVFDALAFNNPYPVQFLDENAWNQLVIKAIFNEKNILDIIGLKTRLNPELSRIAKDLKSERWAANRQIREEIEILIKG